MADEQISEVVVGALTTVGSYYLLPTPVFRLGAYGMGFYATIKLYNQNPLLAGASTVGLLILALTSNGRPGKRKLLYQDGRAIHRLHQPSAISDERIIQEIYARALNMQRQ